MAHLLKLNLKSLHLNRAGLMRGGVMLLFVLCVCVAAAAQTTENVEPVSISGAGDNTGNGPSRFPESSADGRFIVFTSDASDLVPNDTNGSASDIFVRDLQQDTTTLVSVNAAGTTSGNGPSSGASLTPDGRFVIFTSEAGDLVPNDTNGTRDVFVRDLVAQTTTLVSVNGAGTGSGGGASSNGRLTPDGRFVVFTSNAEDLTAGDTNQRADVFRRDLLTGSTVLVSVKAGGANGGNGASSATAITPDGRYVLFASAATDLTSNDTNGSLQDYFRRDLQTGATVLASVNSAGTGSGDSPALEAVMSDDGQVVAFDSAATDLVPPGGAGGSFTFPSIYAHDFAANTTALISEPQVFEGTTATIPPASSPRISSDGRYVFYVRVENFIGGLNRSGFRDRVFRRDRLTGELLELPFVPTGVCDQGVNCRSLITEMTTSHDGRYVAYRQQEQPRSNNPPISTAIVIRDMVGGGAEIVSGFPGAPINQTSLILTPGNIIDGGRLAFSSGVSHSVKDTNQAEDVYLFAPPAQPRLAFGHANYFVTESGFTSPNLISVRRMGYLINSSVTVKYATSDGTATAGSDYIAQSGTLTFGPGESVRSLFIQPINDNLIDPDETVNLTLSDPTGNITLGSPSSTTLTIRNDDLYSFQFSAATYSASESAGGISFTVTLIGAPPGAVSVDYSTSDGAAGERSDYITTAGRLTFAPGETSKTVRVLVVDDNLVEGDETVNLSLSNPTGIGAVLGNPGTAQLQILDNDSTPPMTNPADDPQFFVRQHYLDFLNREPDPSGFNFWTNEITSCADAQCVEVKRINVSAAFFLSIEFQRTGVLAYLANKAAFGAGGSGSPAPILYARFMRDVQQLQQNLVFGEPGFDAQLEANKQEYFAALVARPEFVSAFAVSQTPAQFTDALFTNAGVTPSAEERNAVINEFGSATNTADPAARARALRRVAENTAFAQAEFNRAFVTMEYFGYLRRDPDAAGFNFWLSKLNQFGGDFIRAEMVKAFISSDEYRKRFGP